MSTVSFFIAAMLACLAVAGWRFWRSPRFQLRRELHAFTGTTTRKLTGDERSAIENYLSSLSRTRQEITPTGASTTSATLALNALSDEVLCLTRSITRYGLSTDDPNKWRYYLDAVEVHLPPFWEQYITDDNSVELIRTDSMPLVIALNGHSLLEYQQEADAFPATQPNNRQASIRGEESEQIELLNIRQESPEEYALSRPDGMREAFLVVASLLLMFLCLVTPGVIIPWLLGGALLLLGAGMWGLFARPAKNTLREIHCLRGTPKRWGLFGEADRDHINNISLGIIDLIYPPHWQPWITQDLGQKTDIDIYLDRHVVRQGRFLSLHDEVKNFPLQHWKRNLTIACGSLLVLVMLTVWVPLEMPLKLTVSWLKGAQTVEATSLEALAKAGVRVGDTLRVKGSGMCNIHTPGAYPSRQSSPFMPFDCSRIVWNNARPLPVPDSPIVEKATALSDAVHAQLHPETREDRKVNPQLASAIQKSGLVLLDDFADIVLKTQALCTGEDECTRLKNALVNLGNSRDWASLTRRADTGKLDGVNITLRPVSAESLDNLVTTSTAPFFMRETTRAAQSLNSPAPGGFMIISDEGTDLVDQPFPPMGLYDYPARDQWPEFRRLANMLMHTQFSAEGIVTGIRTDANGTRHITLHSIPDSLGQWRFVGTTLLLLGLIVSLLANCWLAVRRYRRNRHRLQSIQQYYESCFNPVLLPGPDIQPRF